MFSFIEDSECFLWLIFIQMESPLEVRTSQRSLLTWKQLQHQAQEKLICLNHWPVFCVKLLCMSCCFPVIINLGPIFKLSLVS